MIKQLAMAAMFAAASTFTAVAETEAEEENGLCAHPQVLQQLAAIKDEVVHFDNWRNAKQGEIEIDEIREGKLLCTSSYKFPSGARLTFAYFVTTRDGVHRVQLDNDAVVWGEKDDRPLGTVPIVPGGFERYPDPPRAVVAPAFPQTCSEPAAVTALTENPKMQTLMLKRLLENRANIEFATLGRRHDFLHCEVIYSVPFGGFTIQYSLQRTDSGKIYARTYY